MSKPVSARNARTKNPNDSYFSKLQSPQWQKVRLKVFERADWMCMSCGETLKPLTVHHGLYRYGDEPWELPEDTLWCLCEDCHLVLQDQLSDLKLELGRTHPLDYERVMTEILEVKRKRRNNRRAK